MEPQTARNSESFLEHRNRAEPTTIPRFFIWK